MFKPIRVMATLVYLLSMFLTLFCAFKVSMQSRVDSLLALLRRCSFGVQLWCAAVGLLRRTHSLTNCVCVACRDRRCPLSAENAHSDNFQHRHSIQCYGQNRQTE